MADRGVGCGFGWWVWRDDYTAKDIRAYHGIPMTAADLSRIDGTGEAPGLTGMGCFAEPINGGRMQNG
jgi:hypothetical protein